MCIALAYLKIYVVYVIGLATLNGNILILLVEDVNAAYVIVLIPLVEIISDNLAKACKRNIPLGGFAVSGLNENVLCLDGLCFVALSVVGYKQLYPL